MTVHKGCVHMNLCYTCDVSAGACTREDEVIPFVKKTCVHTNLLC